MKLRHIVIILLLASALAPLVYHERLNTLYVKTYYGRIRKYDRARALEEGKQLYRREKFSRLIEFTDDMLILFPMDRGIIRLKGNAMVKTGKPVVGARLVVASLGEKEDLRTVSSSLEVLFNEGEYSDLAVLCARYGVHGDPYLNYMYGVSLFHTARPGEARDRLEAAINAGKRDYDTWYHLGLACEKTGDNEKAVRALEEAYQIDPVKPGARSALIRLYRKAGMYGKAEIMIRRGLK